MAGLQLSLSLSLMSQTLLERFVLFDKLSLPYECICCHVLLPCCGVWCCLVVVCGVVLWCVVCCLVHACFHVVVLMLVALYIYILHTLHNMGHAESTVWNQLYTSAVYSELQCTVSHV